VDSGKHSHLSRDCKDTTPKNPETTIEANAGTISYVAKEAVMGGQDAKEVKELANAHDAEKGEKGDSSKKVNAAGHDFRNDAQDEAVKGDKVSEKITKDWTRDRSTK
jgi:hypothetical protein